MPRARQRVRTLALVGVQLGFLALFAMLLYATGRPLFTDDLWWHLSLGRAFAVEGPWLLADPNLHTAAAPPNGSSWLWDVALYGLQERLGLNSLRVAHVLMVAGVTGLAWGLLRRASGSRHLASLGAACFATLAAYRLFQLRSELFSIFALLALFALLVEGGRTPTPRRIALAALISALWANLHAGFAIGPLLLAVAAIGVWMSVPLEALAGRAAAAARARRLTGAVGICLVAGLINPRGYGAYLPYLRAGNSTPELGLVFDEWAPFALFQLPAVDTQPTLLNFFLLWALLSLTITACMGFRWKHRVKRHTDAALPWDPALLAMSLASLCAALIAVRFLWLGIFPILLILDVLRRAGLLERTLTKMSVLWGLALASWLLVFLFFRFGDWSFMSRGAPTSWARYMQPYSVGKYHLHATWFLEDSGLSGKLYNAYHQGGALSFWLAPELETFVDGSLNVKPGVMPAYSALQGRQGISEEVGFLDLLDHYEIDIFFGIGLPGVQHPNRPWRYTAAHLEGTDGWIPIFRNARSVVYLRDVPRNQENLRRVIRYYEEVGISFEMGRGFDAGAAVKSAPEWALRFGLVPRDFWSLSRAQFSADSGAASRARTRLAVILSVIGLYENAAQALERNLSLAPASRVLQRRRIWALIRDGRLLEAREQALALAELPSLDPLSRFIGRSALEIAKLDDPEGRAARIALLPAYTREEVKRHNVGYQMPEFRVPPRQAH